MSDREKVVWLQALLGMWGSVLIPVLLLLVVSVPRSVQVAQAIAGGILAGWGILTLVYLLILSWRAAYLSGRNKR